jgi:zinc protease
VAEHALDSVFPRGSVHRATLSNGLRVLVRHKRRTGVVAIVTYVGAGYFDETDDVSGIAHVLEHMYFKGTPSLGVGEIAKATKSSGGILNAATIYDHTHYYTVLPSSGFERGLEIQADAYANSLIDEGELARELEVIIEEAKRKADTATAVATETLFELLHDHHRIRRWRIGREAVLRTFTSEKVRAFYRNFYRPRNTVVAIVGDIEVKRAIAAAERYYGSIVDEPVIRSAGPLEPPPFDGGLRYRELSGDVQQSELLLGWRTPEMHHPDTPVLDLIAALLSGGRASRLYRAVRDRRLASSIQAWNYTPTQLGVFAVHATARPENSTSALRAAWDQVVRICDGEANAAEIERSRRMISAQWMRRLETAEGQANHLAAWELDGGWELGGKYLDTLLSANELQVAGVAGRWLKSSRAAALVYRPSNSAPFAADAGSIVGMLGGDRPEPVEGVAMSAPAATVHTGTAAWTLESRDDAVSVYRTQGGVPILVQRMQSSIAHLGWFVNGGAYAEEDELAGVTSLMCRAAIRGTERRSAKQIAEDVEFAGGALTSGAGPDSFQWTLSVPVARLADAAEILADVVQRPAFRADAVEAERAVALAEIASIRDDMYRWPLRMAFDATWGGHPYGRQVLGNEKSVGRLGPQYLSAWHESIALSGKGVLVCVANADPDDVVAMLARRFTDVTGGAAPSVERPSWPDGSQLKVEAREKAQSALAMMFPGPARDDPDRYAASLISAVASGLGGRFFEVLRERQSLAYTVMLSPLVRQLAGAFIAYIAMSPEKEEVARAGLLQEFVRLCESPVTPRELAQAQTYAVGTNAIRRESAGSIMHDMAEAWLFGSSLSEIGEYESRIRAVTAEDIQRVSKRYFDPTRRIEGVIRGAGRKV